MPGYQYVPKSCCVRDYFHHFVDVHTCTTTRLGPPGTQYGAINDYIYYRVSRIFYRSGQVWGHTPEQRVAASTLRRYSFSLRLTIAQAVARPFMPLTLR